MSTHRGIVTGVRRQDQEVDAVVEGAKVAAKYLGGKRFPWPLCEAWFYQQQQRWVCLGPIGHRELLFHDDFLQVTSPNGDTPWTLRTSGAGGSLAAETGMGIGVARVRKTVGDGVAFIHKDSDAVAVPSPPYALWASVRFRYATDQATWFTGISANDVPALYAVAATSDVTATTPAGGTHFGIRLENLGTRFQVASIVEGTVAAVDTFYVGDLLIWSGAIAGSSGNVALGWVDGNGPAGQLADAGAVTPMFGVYNDLTTDVGIDTYVDWVRWERVSLASFSVNEVGNPVFL